MTLPSQLAMTGLQQTFTGLGDADSLAQVKASAQLHHMMMGEATIAAYQDIFILSGFISLFNILPGLLRQREEPEQDEITVGEPQLAKPVLSSEPADH